MLRLLALPLAVMVVLSGCSTSPSSGNEGPVPTTAFTVTGDNRIVEPLFTDTYHLLAKPDLTANAPSASEPVRVPLSSVFQETLKFPDSYRDTWNVTLGQELRGFVGNASLVVEVKGGVAGNPFPTSDGCFWVMNAVLNEGGPGQEFDLGCIPEGAQVLAGIYHLAFPFAFPEAILPAGSVFHFEVHTNEDIERPPGSTVELLTASIPHDSVVQVYGLQLPLEDQLLVAT